MIIGINKATWALFVQCFISSTSGTASFQFTVAMHAPWTVSLEHLVNASMVTDSKIFINQSHSTASYSNFELYNNHLQFGNYCGCTALWYYDVVVPACKITCSPIGLHILSERRVDFILVVRSLQLLISQVTLDSIASCCCPFGAPSRALANYFFTDTSFFLALKLYTSHFLRHCWFLEPPTALFVRRPSLSRTLNITPNNIMSVGCRSGGLFIVKFGKYSDLMFHILKPFITSWNSAACSVGTTWLQRLTLRHCFLSCAWRLVVCKL